MANQIETPETAESSTQRWLTQLEQKQAPPKLKPFQEDGVQELAEARRKILADETGLGKTVQAILACRQLGATHVLVVVPNTLKLNFANQLDLWWPTAPYEVVAGTEQQKLDQIRQFQCGFLIVSYETIQALDPARVKKLKEREARIPVNLVEALQKKKFQVLIIDEAHRLANRKAYATQGAFKLAAHAQAVFLLTATPMQNRLGDLWPLLKIVNPRVYTSYWDFMKRHADAHPGIYGWVSSDSPTNPEALRAEIEPYFLRRTKREVADELPKRTHYTTWLELEGEHKRIYSEMETEMIARLGPEDADIISAPIVLAQIMRLKQICVNPNLVGGPDVSPKMDFIAEKIREIPPDEKAIVFTQFAEAIPLLISRLHQKAGVGCTWVAGSSHMKEMIRDERVSLFQNSEQFRVLIGTHGSLGEGHTLTAASYVFHLDRHWNPMRHEQIESRVDRFGQTRPITINNLLITNSVEMWIESLLEHKLNIIEEVVHRIKKKWRATNERN